MFHNGIVHVGLAHFPVAMPHNGRLGYNRQVMERFPGRNEQHVPAAKCGPRLRRAPGHVQARVVPDAFKLRDLVHRFEKDPKHLLAAAPRHIGRERHRINRAQVDKNTFDEPDAVGPFAGLPLAFHERGAPPTFELGLQPGEIVRVIEVIRPHGGTV